MKKANITLLLLIFCNTLFSQQIKVVRDIGFWGGINLEKELSDDIEINFEQQIRMYNNVSKVDDYFFDLGAKYKINKNFGLGANVRFTHNEKRWREADNEYRYNLDLRYKGKLASKLKLHYRIRYQQEFVDLLFKYKTTKNYHSSVRNKIELEYKANEKNEFYISGELFRLIESYKAPYFNKIRYFIGDKFKSKIGTFNCSLGYEQEINTNYPTSFYFFKTVYTLKL